jgi:hypothetical protein
MPAQEEQRPHDELIEPVYSGLRGERAGAEPAERYGTGPEPGGARPPLPPEPREPAGVGGFCGLVILLAALLVIGSLAVIFFGASE